MPSTGLEQLRPAPWKRQRGAKEIGALRIAHIISDLRIGGAERNVVNLLNAFRGHYRAVICVDSQRSGPTFHHQLDPDVKQYEVQIRRRSLPVGVVRLANLLRKDRINVVHTHMYAANLYGAVAARLARVPVVVTSEHGENPWKGSIERLIERHVISPLADVRLCVSSAILARRRDLDGVPAEKLRLVANGAVIPPGNLPDRPANEVVVVGAIGRLITAKDYPALLRAVTDLRSRGHHIRVCLVGDGPEAETIRGIVSELSLDEMVELPGVVTDVDRWYRQFDIFVSSSVREGFPMVLLEAMAHGLPVVATDVGACAEVVQHGDGGLIVPPGDPLAMANAVSRLIDDPLYRRSLGRGARDRVERLYSVTSVADRHLQIYGALLSGRGVTA